MDTLDRQDPLCGKCIPTIQKTKKDLFCNKQPKKEIDNRYQIKRKFNRLHNKECKCQFLNKLFAEGLMLLQHSFSNDSTKQSKDVLVEKALSLDECDSNKKSGRNKKSLLKNNKGFSLVEVLAGVSIMLLTISFYLVMIHFYNGNKTSYKTKSKMIEIVQNSVEALKVTTDSAATINTLKAEYTNYNITYQALSYGLTNLDVNTITVDPKNNPESLSPYTHVYYTAKKSILN